MDSKWDNVCKEQGKSTPVLVGNSLELIRSSGYLQNPYKDMPILKRMSKRLPIPCSLTQTFDKTSESVFVTLARCCFPLLIGTQLTALPLDTIYKKAKKIFYTWCCCKSDALAADDKQFLISLFKKGVEFVEMSEWERLRDVFVSHFDAFKKNRQRRQRKANKKVVKELPPGISLQKHLPRCGSLSRAKASIRNYISIVNLGERIPLKSWKTFTFYQNTHIDITSDAMDEKSLIRNHSSRRRSGSIVDALKSQLDELNPEGIKLGGNGTAVQPEFIEGTDWVFNEFTEFEETLTYTGASIFQDGAPEVQLEGLSREHFDYPADQVTLDNGLTQREQEAFEELEYQLKTYVIKEEVSIEIEISDVYTTAVETSVRSKKTAPPVLPTRSSARLAKGSGIVSRRILRKFSYTSSIESEAIEIEVISEREAIRTALKVPQEYAKPSIVAYAKACAEGQTPIFERDFQFPSDPDDRVLSDTSIGNQECSTVSRSHEQSELEAVGYCGELFCVLGCICSSLNDEVTAQIRGHCGKLRCLLGCVCLSKSVLDVDESSSQDIRNRLRPRAHMNWKKLKNNRLTFNSENITKEKTKEDFQKCGGRKRAREGSLKSTREKKFDLEETSNDSFADSYRGLGLKNLQLWIPSPESLEEEEEPPDDDTLSPSEPDNSISWKQYGCKPCHVKTTPLCVELPIDEIQAKCGPIHAIDESESSLESDSEKLIRKPLPLQLLEVKEQDITLLAGEYGIYALVEWKSDVNYPKATKIDTSNFCTNVVISLPIPPKRHTYFLFLLPPDIDGDVELCLQQMRIQVSLENVQKIRVENENSETTRRIQFVNASNKPVFCSNGIPCEVHTMPLLPNLWVFGPCPVHENQDFELSPNVNEDSYMASSPGTPIYFDESMMESISPKWQHPTQSHGGDFSDENWNGDGELIPTNYFQNVMEDFMIEFPPQVETTVESI